MSHSDYCAITSHPPLLLHFSQGAQNINDADEVACKDHLVATTGGACLLQDEWWLPSSLSLSCTVWIRSQKTTRLRQCWRKSCTQLARVVGSWGSAHQLGIALLGFKCWCRVWKGGLLSNLRFKNRLEYVNLTLSDVFLTGISAINPWCDWFEVRYSSYGYGKSSTGNVPQANVHLVAPGLYSRLFTIAVSLQCFLFCICPCRHCGLYWCYLLSIYLYPDRSLTENSKSRCPEWPAGTCKSIRARAATWISLHPHPLK